MGLEQLPPELLALVLEAVGSPRDLFHLISASAPCLRVFTRSSTHILWSVIQNAAPTSTINHLKAIALSSRVSESAKDLRAVALQLILDQYFEGNWVEFSATRAEILYFCRLLNRINVFTQGYTFYSMLEFQRSITELSDCRSAGRLADSQDWSVLSDLEHTRFQRAFLRFELYCRLFPVDHKEQLHSLFSAEEQFDMFLARLAPWEVEEIVCVHHYLSKLFQSHINDMGKSILQTIQNTPGVHIPSRLATKREEWDEGEPADSENQDMVNFEDLDEYGLTLFSIVGRSILPDYVSYLTSLGIEFAYQLERVDDKECYAAIRANTPILREFLPEALYYGNPNVRAERIVAKNPHRANLGYELFSLVRFRGYSVANSYPWIIDPRFRSSWLRDLGYVFWDDDRVRSPGVYEVLAKAQQGRWSDIQRRISQPLRESVEDQLPGVRLPLKTMESLEEQFGSTVDDSDWPDVTLEAVELP